ncbi:HNH endonuclease signature motif containing protein [Parashewanella curva]|uniref:HNH endonuclease n=1 Tax=Parashewanella curva TaxID=2338552 RepID=UPI001A9FA635
MLLKAIFSCRDCGVTYESGAPLHVGHIKPRSRYPELALELSNLQILCSECNIGKSNRSETSNFSLSN